jgi:hypothetical protein
LSLRISPASNSPPRRASRTAARPDAVPACAVVSPSAALASALPEAAAAPGSVPAATLHPVTPVTSAADSSTMTMYVNMAVYLVFTAALTP